MANTSKGPRNGQERRRSQRRGQPDRRSEVRQEPTNGDRRKSHDRRKTDVLRDPK